MLGYPAPPTTLVFKFPFTTISALIVTTTAATTTTTTTVF